MAEDMMTRNVVTMTEDMPVQDFIKLLQRQHLIRTPVVKGKTLVGVATRRDAVFAYGKATARLGGREEAVVNFDRGIRT